MSTAKIREALEALEEHATTDCQSAAAARVVQAKLTAAFAEVEAIERAATDFYESGLLDSAVDGLSIASETLKAIAKDAP